MDLIILTGLQAAGKSTFYQTHFGASGDYVYVSKDQLRNNRQPVRRQHELIVEALSARRSAVVDNTNPSPADRAPLTALGKAYGATVSGYFFIPEVKASLERNRQRTGRMRVPDVAIFATRKRLVPPTYAEGFDHLFTVSIPQSGSFLVQELELPA